MGHKFKWTKDFRAAIITNRSPFHLDPILKGLVIGLRMGAIGLKLSDLPIDFEQISFSSFVDPPGFLIFCYQLCSFGPNLAGR
jgi:hypothetical protein